MIPGCRVFPLNPHRREAPDPGFPPAAVAVPAPAKVAVWAVRAAAEETAFETEERARAQGWWQVCPCSTR